MMGSWQPRWPAGKKIPNTAILVVGLSAVVLIVIVIALVATCRSPSQNVGLNAEVTFDGTQFVISNKNNFDWTNVKVEVNGGVVFPGFSYSIPQIAAEQTYTVSGVRFFKPDGSQFDPGTTKIQRFTISCDTPNGPGSWSSTWQ
jgi:hypothetical protein